MVDHRASASFSLSRLCKIGCATRAKGGEEKTAAKTCRGLADRDARNVTLINRRIVSRFDRTSAKPTRTVVSARITTVLKRPRVEISLGKRADIITAAAILRDFTCNGNCESSRILIPFDHTQTAGSTFPRRKFRGTLSKEICKIAS